jgi:hypothetical protein
MPQKVGLSDPNRSRFGPDHEQSFNESEVIQTTFCEVGLLNGPLLSFVHSALMFGHSAMRQKCAANPL